MVCVQTKMLVTDNFGALYAQCIKILGSAATYARLGDILIVSIKRALPLKKVKEHEVRRGVLVREARRSFRGNGMVFNASDNAIVLLDGRNNPLGTRVFGVVAQELRMRKQLRVIVIAEAVV
jgi:large subunit ribosomal protein L14